MLIVGLLQIFIMTNQTNNVFEEYPKIGIGDTIKCKVISCKSFKGTSLIVDDRGNSFSVKAYSKTLNPSSMFEYCEQGDSLIRLRDSKVILLKKANLDSDLQFEILIVE